VVSFPPRISPSETTLHMRTDFLGLLRFMWQGYHDTDASPATCQLLPRIAYKGSC
jgi:hypothetical protein